MVLGPSMDGGETLLVTLLHLQCAFRLLVYQCKSLHPTISLDYNWFLRSNGVAVLCVGIMQTLLVLSHFATVCSPPPFFGLGKPL